MAQRTFPLEVYLKHAHVPPYPHGDPELEVVTTLLLAEITAAAPLGELGFHVSRLRPFAPP